MSLLRRFVVAARPGLLLTSNERGIAPFRTQTLGATRLQTFSTAPTSGRHPIPPKAEPMQTFDIKGREKSPATATTTTVTRISPQLKDTVRSYPRDTRKESAAGGRSSSADPVAKDKDDEKKFRVNEDITGVEEAMLVGPEGAMGKMSFEEIKRQAAKFQLDMVEVSRTPTSVIKLMNFQVFVEEKRALRKQREELMGTQPKQLEDILPPVKEVQVSTSIEHHDFELKKEFIRKFLLKGHPVKLMLRMKKSNSVKKEARPQRAQELIERITSDLADVLALDKIKNDPKPVMGTVVKFFYPKDHIIKAITGADVPANLASKAVASSKQATSAPRVAASSPPESNSPSTTATTTNATITQASNSSSGSASARPLITNLTTTASSDSNGRAVGGNSSTKQTVIQPQTSSASGVNKKTNINNRSSTSPLSQRKPNGPQFR